MDHTLISRIFLDNWQRKLIAVLCGLVIWWLVNNSITETTTIPNVPIHIVNLPPDKTIVGLLPNRLLSKRVTLTLSGTKDVIQELEPGDLEVMLDASTAEGDQWVVHIGKKNLVSLNPAIDLVHHITQVEHPELVLKLSRLVKAKIPIQVLPPTGEAPQGYDFLDVWPQQLIQTVTASEEEIQTLKAEGLELLLNLNDITKADLDALKPSKSAIHDDEISFLVPDKFKKIIVNDTIEEINDPEAQSLRIDFLRQESRPVGRDVPIRVYYPMKFSKEINANTYPLAENDIIRKENDIYLLTAPLFVRDVSRLFLEIISDNMEIDIVAAPKTEREFLQWSLEVIDPHELEDMYVAYILVNAAPSLQSSKLQEMVLRKRFQEYLQRLALYTGTGQRLRLEATLEKNAIQITIPK